ncbi:MAG: hypothetical protein EA368_09585 [Leptolyngbya sp. DLM2.Bin27]|nr:MAG: hypothetical protein EA368_09585 [Leptolyngbya sp. DLM2.Bin27]
MALVAIALLTFTTASCAKPTQPTELISEPTPQPNRLTGQIAEVSPPETLESLKQIIDAYTPQVRLLSPRPGEVLSDTAVTVRLQVRGLPLFKDETYQLGPHLHLFLDNEPYRAIYDLSEPITFENLAPGTHTLRVFASRPWHESFKNQGAFDQRTFHVVAPTPQNELDANTPLLTYSRPQSSYGAEPIMLDFYLTNAPLHMSAQAEANDDLHDWRIRCTVNDQSFVFDQWQPIWLKGFKPGRNWVQLELIDEAGNPIDNRFNNTIRIIDYQPGGTDSLSRLVRGELDIKEVAGIIDPTYVPPAPPEPEVLPETEPEVLPEVLPETAVPPSEDNAPETPASQPTEAEGAAAQPEAPALKAPPQPAPALTAPSTEIAPAEPPVPDSLTPAERDAAIQPNPFLQPESPPDAEAPAPLAPKDLEILPEDRDAIAPEADQPKTADETADPPSTPTTDNPVKDKDGDLALPETPADPPVLGEPDIQPDDIQIEALPEPEPLAPDLIEPEAATPNLTLPRSQQEDFDLEPDPGTDAAEPSPVEQAPPPRPRSPLAPEVRPFI